MINEYYRPGEGIVADDIEEVDPHRAGWQRHPTKPKTWVTDGGELYIFPPRQREIIFRVKWRPDGRKPESDSDA